jgi:D-3-phosphoglycerate dehydrogenase
MIKVAIGPSSFAKANYLPQQLLEDAGITVIQNPYGRRLTEEEILNQLEGAEGLIAGLEPLHRRVLEQRPQLKVIARVGIGMDNVDQVAAKELGIKVSNTPEGPTNAVAEMAITNLLALGRGIIPANKALHQKEWKKTIGFGIEGLNVVLIGYGRIGRRFADHLRYFGANIFVVDPYVDVKNLTKGEKKVSIAEGLPIADVVSIHVPGSEEILGSEQFAMMKDGVFLLNSARGPVVNEDALAAALDSGKVAGGWLDVFCEEPYTGKLTEYQQLILTPHLSTYSRQCRLSMETKAVENLLRDLGVK